MNTAAKVAVLALAFAGLVLIFAFLARLRGPARFSGPYRKIVLRTPATDGEGGEIVELECGHCHRLIYENPQAIPCQDCREQATVKE